MLFTCPVFVLNFYTEHIAYKLFCIVSYLSISIVFLNTFIKLLYFSFVVIKLNSATSYKIAKCTCIKVNLESYFMSYMSLQTNV